MAKIIPKNAPPRANKIVTGNFPMTDGNASNTALKLNSLLSGTCFKKSAYQLAVKRLVVNIFVTSFLEHKHSITFTIGIPKIATEIEK